MKIGFVFSGYGSQWVGMGKDLYDESRIVQELFEEASSCLDMNFVKLCFASSDAELSKIENAYVAIYVVSTAIAQVLKEAGIVPTQVAGYDIGEYGAITTVDALSIPDALYLLKKYATFYQAFLDEQPVKGLRVSGIDQEVLEKLCKKASKKADFAVISVHESRNTYVVAATYDAGLAVEDALREMSGVTFSDVSVQGGFHAPVMDGIVKHMKMYLEKVDFKDAQAPFVAAVIGQDLVTGESIVQRLCNTFMHKRNGKRLRKLFLNVIIFLK